MHKFDIGAFKRQFVSRCPSEVKPIEKAAEETVKPTPEAPVEEWVWVDGFKGMDKNMQCHNNFQYEIGKRYDMPEDANIEACRSGFHLCLTLEDVFGYVKLGDNNRFFEVRALVRKSDTDCYKSGVSKNLWGGISYTMSSNGGVTAICYSDKLAAKSIEIVRELTIDEILEHTNAKDWDIRYKALAIELGINGAQNFRYADELVEYGYSRPFAQWLSKNSKYEIAKAVGAQTDLSMDMKCLMIING